MGNFINNNNILYGTLKEFHGSQSVRDVYIMFIRKIKHIR
jgi:hypothetical protein